MQGTDPLDTRVSLSHKLYSDYRENKEERKACLALSMHDAAASIVYREHGDRREKSGRCSLSLSKPKFSIFTLGEKLCWNWHIEFEPHVYMHMIGAHSLELTLEMTASHSTVSFSRVLCD